MAAPWEKYAAPEPQGPWSKFAPKVDREAIAKQIDSDPISQGARNFAGEMSAGGQSAAAVGKVLTDVGQAAKQMVGMGPNAAQVAERKKLDAPLLNTMSGGLTNIAANIGVMAPMALVPGANTVAGAGTMGALSAAMQPTESPEDRLTNMGVGFGVGAGTQAAVTKGAQALGERAAEKLKTPQKPTLREETLQRGVEAGYVVPPSTVNPSFINTKLESLAGKAAVGQDSAIRNQSLTDALARTEAGLPKNEVFSRQTLASARDEMAAPYREVASLSERASAALKDWKEANKMAQKWYQAYERLPIPSMEAKAERFVNQAAMALDTMENEARAVGRVDLIPSLKQARVNIAKNFDVERAMNVGSGEIDASVLGRMLDSGRPLSGNLETIARMQQAFPHFMREGGRVPTPGVSGTDPIVSGLLATGGAAASGSPTGLLAGGLPLLRGPARNLALSPSFQKANVLAQPQGPTALTRETATLADPAVKDKLAALARALALPSIPAFQATE